MPHLQTYYEVYQAAGLEVVVIARDTTLTVSKVKPMVAAEGWTFPVLYDTGQKVSNAYHVKYSPVTFVVSNKGEILFQHAGYKPGQEFFLALDAAGHPHISYFDNTNDDLKYASWNGSTWDIQTVDSTGNVGRLTSLALDSAGNPHISYFDDSQTALGYAYWDGTTWIVLTVDNMADMGRSSSLAIDTAGHPLISYYDMSEGYLRLARSVCR